MRYLSICSGIEAATVAWHPLGWQPVAFAEIDAFPSAVLAHHYPDVPNLGDFTRITRDAVGPIDLLVGGTPCQSFSIAGLRAGLDDERGNLALEFCKLARRLGPQWIIWENVPGVLSLDGGRAFASILGGLAECGYGLAYRVLDAQYVRVDGFGRAVPQRRRRVFVVGHLGDWRRAAAVLFERQGLSWDSAPRRQPGQRTAPTLAARTRGGGGLGTDFDCDCGLIANEIASTLTRGAESAGKGGYAGRRQEDDINIVAFGGNDTTGPIDVATACRAKGGTGHGDFESETFLVAPSGADAAPGAGVAHALRADGFDVSEDGTGRGTPLVPVVAGPLTACGGTERKHGQGWGQQEWESGYAVPVAVAFDETQITHPENRSNPQPNDPCHPLASGARPPAIAFNARHDPDVFEGHTGPLDTDGNTQGIFSAWRVRRLMPVECERLQGFPDGYTAIQYRGKPAADGPRYKALGNSFAVNVVRWIGWRIKAVEEMGAGNEDVA